MPLEAPVTSASGLPVSVLISRLLEVWVKTGLPEFRAGYPRRRGPNRPDGIGRETAAVVSGVRRL
jgi:hypothetical protein